MTVMTVKSIKYIIVEIKKRKNIYRVVNRKFTVIAVISFFYYLTLR